jgi:hypothetical protein
LFSILLHCLHLERLPYGAPRFLLNSVKNLNILHLVHFFVGGSLFNIDLGKTLT